MTPNKHDLIKLFDLVEECPPLHELPAPLDRRVMRRQAGVTLEGAAVVVGVSWNAIYRWESQAQTPSARVILRYLRFLAACKRLAADR